MRQYYFDPKHGILDTYSAFWYVGPEGKFINAVDTGEVYPYPSQECEDAIERLKNSYNDNK